MVLVILMIILVHILETHSCNIKVCLTWSAMKDKITFKCRVNALSWQVKFFNQFHNEQAYCMSPIPFSHCYPLSTNCTITQDALRNITMLSVRGRIDNSINGAWTCYHGTNVDKAVVNVTVLREAVTTGKQEDCSWENNTAWTFFGVLLAFVVLHIIRCMNNVEGSKNKNKQNCTPSVQCFNSVNLLVLKRVMFFMLIIVLISLPLVINIGKDDCSGQYAFIAFGFIMGFPVTYLLFTEPGIKCCHLRNKDTNSDTSQLTTTSNVETQQENISDEESQQQSQMVVPVQHDEHIEVEQYNAGEDETAGFPT